MPYRDIVWLNHAGVIELTSTSKFLEKSLPAAAQNSWFPETVGSVAPSYNPGNQQHVYAIPIYFFHFP